LATLTEKFGSPKAATDLLVKIFAKMVFHDGHVHCDAHPGNILVRRNPKNPKLPQIVLLDHGFYCHTSDKFRKQFINLWFAMITMDYQTVRSLAEDMGMGQYYRYLPLLFTYRTINTKKPLGGEMAPEEKQFLKENNEGNLEKIGMLL